MANATSLSFDAWAAALADSIRDREARSLRGTEATPNREPTADDGQDRARWDVIHPGPETRASLENLHRWSHIVRQLEEKRKHLPNREFTVVKEFVIDHTGIPLCK